ncbi:MAG: DUF4386 domain-containing protein [Gammaproteobacteria bacterium]|nr:DUF4386 domain-containing protein [Gammaproteobacteria bacterium]
MQNSLGAISPQTYVRTAGLLYLIVIILGGFAYGYVPSRLISHDAATTANNILAHEFLWRIAIVSGLIMVICAIPLLLCEYVLLRPVHRAAALLAVFFNLISLAIESISGLGHLAALLILKGVDSMKAFDPGQLRALALLSADLHDYEVMVSFVFFGCVCLIYGYLIFRSGFFPRFLGVLMAIAGLCYLTNSLAGFLGLDLAAGGFPWMLLPAGLSELTFCLWLLVMGVNAGKWQEKARLVT